MSEREGQGRRQPLAFFFLASGCRAEERKGEVGGRRGGKVAGGRPGGVGRRGWNGGRPEVLAVDGGMGERWMMGNAAKEGELELGLTCDGKREGILLFIGGGEAGGARHVARRR